MFEGIVIKAPAAFSRVCPADLVWSLTSSRNMAGEEDLS